MGKNIEDEVRKIVGNEPVPESLSPERMEEMLKGHKTRRFSYRKLGAVAAAVAIVALTGSVGIYTWHSGKGEETAKEQTVKHTAKKEAGEVMDRKLPEGVTQAKNYKQVFDILDDSDVFYYNDSIKDEVAKGESYVYESVEDKGMEFSDSALPSVDSENETDYSEVNTQVEGVAEADIMVTDGRYLYMGHESRNRICIVAPDIQTGALTLSSSIDLGEDVNVQAMYIKKGQLTVLANEYEDIGSGEEPHDVQPSFVGDLLFEEDVCTASYRTKAGALAITFDVSDPRHPQEQGRVRADGSYMDSRMVDGYLYMFSQYNDFRMESKEEARHEDSYIPQIQGDSIAPERIFIPDSVQADGYLVGVSVDLNAPDQVKDEFAVMMYGSECYVSQKNVYIAQDYNDLQLIRFAYQDGKIGLEASGKVRGCLNDNFSMDEFNGYLRVVTTRGRGDAVAEGEIKDIESVGSETMELKRVSPDDEVVNGTVNDLYVLDMDLKVTGKIEGLAPGEKIYSARFMGAVGYFVTYREVDPLFSVDLSDPYNPRVLGELKISGFSEYLHPYGDGRLLGIGWETSSNGYGGMKQDGVKLSMFDISDPANVSELARMMEETAIETSVGKNHHAVLVSVDRNLFGFCIQTVSQSYYCTYRYVDGVGFEKVTDTRMDGDWVCWETRAVYIDNILYISDGGHVYAVSLKDGAALDELYLN